MVYEIKKVKHIFEVAGKVVGYIMGDYYFRSRKVVDMFYARYPNMVLITGTFVENKTEQIQNKLKLYGYMVPLNVHAITRQ